MNELTGRVAIVTGGGSGIGKAVAELFAEESAAGLTIADIRGDTAKEVAASVVERFGAKAIATETDVSNEALVDDMVARTIEEFGRVDILVNNAGICPVVAWDDTTLEDWNRILAVNVTGAYISTKAVLPHMRRQKYGRIVNISSVGGFLGSVIAHVAYGVSKAGMIALTKVIAKTFAADGVYANAIAPGSIDTPLTDSFGEEQKRRFREMCPLGRQGSPRELADAVLYLSTDRSNYLTGATLHVNGGSLLI